MKRSRTLNHVTLAALLNGIALACIAREHPVIKWERCLGGRSDNIGWSIRPARGGGHYLAGNSASNDGDVTGNHGGEDFWIVRVDAQGNIVWERLLGGSGDDAAFSVFPTRDRGCIAAGITKSTDSDVVGNHGATDGWVVKLDTAGDVQWKRCYGGSGVDYIRGIVQTMDGGYIFTGLTMSTDGDIRVDGDVQPKLGSALLWVVRTDSLGNILWQHAMVRTPDGEHEGHAVALCGDGGYVIAGKTVGVDSVVSGGFMAGEASWVLRLDSVGHILWDRVIGDTTVEGVSEANDVVLTKDHGFMLVGRAGCLGDTVGCPKGLNLWAAKLDSLGHVEWQRIYGGNGDEVGKRVVQTRDSGYLIAAWSNSDDGDVSGNHHEYDSEGKPTDMPSTDAWIVKLTPQGSIAWEYSYGGRYEDLAYGIVEAPDGGSIFVGCTASQDGDVSGCPSSVSDWFNALWLVTLGPAPTAASESVVLPMQPHLLQNHPNPVVATTTISLQLSPEEVRIARLRVYNGLGVLVMDLTNQLHAGREITFDASGLAAGVYPCVLETGNARTNRALVVVR